VCWVGLGLALVTLALYWPVRGHDFINYDDTDYVTRNAIVQRGLTFEGLAWAFGQLHGTNTYWHPLTWLSHMLDCQLFGLKPGPHHLMNVFFHMLNAVLVLVLWYRLTGALWRSAMLAALFAWHPLQVDTVAWVAERKNLLSACFWLLTMLAYVRYVQRPRPLRYAWVLLLFVLGLMTKPVLVTLPAVLLLLDIWPLRRLQRGTETGAESPPATNRDESRSSASVLTEPTAEGGVESTSSANLEPETRNSKLTWRWLLLEKLPLLVLAIASGLITLFAHRGLGMAQSGLALNLRIENALISYVRYVSKTLWPTDLSVLYLHPGSWPPRTVDGALLLLAIMTAAVLWARRRAPYLAIGWFWFLTVLVPFLGLVQVGVQAMADRFAYLPVVGLFLMLVWSVSEMTARWRSRPIVLGAVSAAVLSGCLVTSSLQLRYWRDSITLFAHAAQVEPNNFIAHNNLASALLAAGRWNEALSHVEEALRHKPDSAETHALAGMVFEAQNKPAAAYPHYETAARLKSDWELPRLGMAHILSRAGQIPQAIEQYMAAVELAPGDADAHIELAVLLASQQRVAEAIQHYRAALTTWPDSPLALNNLAWLLATHPRDEVRNGPEAVRLAERACAVTQRQQAFLIGTLAAAYAEAGQFADAVKAAQEAQVKATAAGQTEIAARNAQLLTLYQAHKPFRQSGSK
jgi:Flp pilus assembly protein TadD